MRDAHRAGRESRRAAVELGRKLSAEAEGPVAEPRSRGPSDRGPVRIGVLAATLNREADAEIARILRCQEGRWEPKRPALGAAGGETTTAAVIPGSLRTTQRAR